MLQGYLSDCGPCPYLPDRTFRAFLPEPNPPPGMRYRDLMDLRFRRSGNQVYMPMCQGCSACQPIRVAVETFQPRTDQRRCVRRNADLQIAVVPRGVDAERLALYRRYQTQVHHSDVEHDDGSSLAADGGIPGGELHARDANGQLLAVSIIDVCDDALSSVYCYYDPDQLHRSLGTFMALAEIQYAQSLGLTWWYMGFLVEGCAKMAYKARFGPCELLVDGKWRTYAPAATGSGPTT